MRYHTQRTITYRAHDSQGPTPALILQGRFLEGFGFKLGGRCEVAYAPGAITIQAHSCPINFSLVLENNLTLATIWEK